MLYERFASPKFGYMRDINHYFEQQILSKLRDKNTFMTNKIFLRCLLYTFIHFHAIRKCIKSQEDNNNNDKEKQLKYKYLEILRDIMSILRKKGLSTMRFNEKMCDLYWKSYCTDNFNSWWNQIDRARITDTMSNFGKLFIVSLFLHTVIHWGGFSDLYLRIHDIKDYESYKDRMLSLWLLRDILSISLSVSLIFWYRSMVQIFMRERFCWLYDGDILNESLSVYGNRSYHKNLNEAYLAYETIYSLLWSEKMRDYLRDIIKENKYHWMIDIIIEFCYGINMNDITNIKMWNEIIFENENFEYQMIVPHIGNSDDDENAIETAMMDIRRHRDDDYTDDAMIDDKGYFTQKITKLLNDT